MDTDALEATIKDLVARGTRPKLIYTISVYQNPMGVTLSAERRRHMVEISQSYGIPILENESYADFPHRWRPTAAGDVRDGRPRTASCTCPPTRSCLACGLRLGFAVVPDEVKEVVGRLRFGTAPSHLASMAVYEYLTNHGDEYIAAVARSLGAKRDAMLAALGERFPPSCEWSSPNGGMMLVGQAALRRGCLEHPRKGGRSGRQVQPRPDVSRRQVRQRPHPADIQLSQHRRDQGRHRAPSPGLRARGRVRRQLAAVCYRHPRRSCGAASALNSVGRCCRCPSQLEVACGADPALQPYVSPNFRDKVNLPSQTFPRFLTKLASSCRTVVASMKWERRPCPRR